MYNVFTSSSYRTFADNDDVFLFSTRLIVLKLYDGKGDTVENVHFKKRAVLASSIIVSHVRITCMQPDVINLYSRYLHGAKTLTIHGNSLQLCSMSVSNFVFALHLLTAQELIASFLTNTYRIGGPNLIIEGA